MKILYAFDLYSPHGGGIVTVMRDVSKALAVRGHKVTILASDYKKDQAFLDSAPSGVNIRLIHCQCNFFNFCYMPSLRKEARHLLKDFDIIHLQTYRSYQNLVLSKEARLGNIPYILESHGTLPRSTGGKRSTVWLLKHLFDAATGMRILKAASRVIAHTEASIEEYVDFGVERDKVVLLPPPFDIAEFANLPSEGNFRHLFNIRDQKIILSLGRIHRIKGLDFLVDSFTRLTRLRNDVVLVIAGNDDGYLDTLKARIKRLGIEDKVVFTGFLQGEIKLAALRDANVLVQPSLYEYNSRVMYESILCGTPVIVSSATMSSENLTKLNAGFLVDFGNHDQMITAIQQVIDNPQSMQDKVDQAAGYIRSNLSLEKVAEQYESLYSSLVKSPR